MPCPGSRDGRRPSQLSSASEGPQVSRVELSRVYPRGGGGGGGNGENGQGSGRGAEFSLEFGVRSSVQASGGVRNGIQTTLLFPSAETRKHITRTVIELSYGLHAGRA